MKFQFEFIEYTNGFVRLTLMPTLTRASQESKPGEGLKQSALTIQPRGHTSNRNNEKYIHR